MKKSKIEQWLVYVSLMPWGTFPGSKDRLSKEKNNFITGKYWDHNYAVYGLIKSYITKKKLYYPQKKINKKAYICQFCLSSYELLTCIKLRPVQPKYHKLHVALSQCHQVNVSHVITHASLLPNECVRVKGQRLCPGNLLCYCRWIVFNEYNCSSLYVVCFVWLILIFEEMFSGCSSFLKIRWYTNSIINLNRV